MDRYTKIILTIIAANLSLLTLERAARVLMPRDEAQATIPVKVVGGQLDYETDLTVGPTLKVQVVE